MSKPKDMLSSVKTRAKAESKTKAYLRAMQVIQRLEFQLSHFTHTHAHTYTGNK